MNRHDDHFSPDHVDEQIEYLSRDFSPAPSQLEPAKDLLHALHVLYEEEKKEDARSLDRAWSRIAAVDDQQYHNRSQDTVRSIMMKEPGTFSITQFERRWRPPLTRRFAILAMVACLAILVGSAVFLFHTMTNGRNTNAGGPFQGTVTATSGPVTSIPPTSGPVTPIPGGK